MPAGKPNHIVKRGVKALEVFKGLEKFECERDLCDFLEENLSSFCKEHLGCDLEDYEREKQVENQFYFGQGRTKRIDFYVELEDGQRVGIECKARENNSLNAISQLLAYSVLDDYDRHVIVASYFDDYIQEVIDKFELPFEVYYLTSNYTLSYSGE